MYFLYNDLLITPNYILPIKSITNKNNLLTIMLETTKDGICMLKSFCGKYEYRRIHIKALDLPNSLPIKDNNYTIVGFKIKRDYIVSLPNNYNDLVNFIKIFSMEGVI